MNLKTAVESGRLAEAVGRQAVAPSAPRTARCASGCPQLPAASTSSRNTSPPTAVFGFKLFMSDVGLLAHKCGLEPRVLLEGSRLFTEFKGTLTEQFVAQELIACGLSPFYWSNPDGKSEVDFVVSVNGEVVPVEVKAAENLQSKSLKIYSEKYQPTRCVRTSMADYREEPWLVNVPLYGIGAFFQEEVD
ncbi:MAG: DUF4143 domain-containing protein [Puniceicoccales bacterium]|nr:DUF4143 domain-containing protein [Puniceicoccales bacterium]